MDISSILRSASINIGALSAKASLVNLDSGEAYKFLFNPEEVRTPDIKAIYDESNPAFSSAPRMRYKHTTAKDWVFTLYLSSTTTNNEGLVNLISLSRNLNNDVSFLESLVYPLEGKGIKDRRPPSVRFVWPDLANVKVKVLSVGTHYRKFNFRLQQQLTAVDIVLREDHNKPITSNLIRTRGSNGRPGLLGGLLDKLPSGAGSAVDSISSFI